MTNEEAIEYNKNLREYMRITDTESEFKFLKENYEALDMAIKALEQEPCEDCISRAEAINAIEEYGSVWMEYTEEMSIHQIAERALKASKQSMYKILHDLPSVQPKPKTGHWKQYGNSWEDKYKCSECGEAQPKILCGEKIIGHWSNYCPNCGAEMTESDG